MEYGGNLAGQVHVEGATARDFGVDFVESQVGGERQVLITLEGVTVGSVSVTHGVNNTLARQLIVMMPLSFLRSRAGREFADRISELAGR